MTLGESRLGGLGKGALALAAIAVLALAGTAVGAKLITGKQVKDASLTGKDVKDGSLAPADFRGSVAGPQGPQGPQGQTGPAGMSASASAAANPDTDLMITGGYADLVSTTINVPAQARVIGDGTVSIYRPADNPAEATRCGIRIDGELVGQPLVGAVPAANAGQMISISQGSVVPAGQHTVSIACQTALAGVSQTLAFDQGTLTAVATAP